MHPYIEFGNRLLTFVVGVVARRGAWSPWSGSGRAARDLARRWPPCRCSASSRRRGSAGSPCSTALHPLTVAAHFLLSMVLVAASTVLLLRAGEGDAATPPSCVRAGSAGSRRSLAVVAAAVLVLGTVVTGSGPHSGDADDPGPARPRPARR